MKQNPLGVILTVALTFGAIHVLRNGVSSDSYLYLPALLLLPFIVGPLAIFLTVRTPSRPAIEAVPISNPSIPPEHRETIEALTQSLLGLGFEQVGTDFFRCSDPKKHAAGTIAILQHPETSDMASIIGFKDGGLLGFARNRSDGTRIRTGFSTMRNTTPPHPADDVLRIRGFCKPDWLWALHSVRVENDPLRAKNPSPVDAFSYQIHEELDGINNFIRCGYWTPMSSNERQLRVTVRGAIMSALRLMTPTAQIFDSLDRLKLKEILKKTGCPTEQEYRRSTRNSAPNSVARAR